MEIETVLKWEAGKDLRSASPQRLGFWLDQDAVHPGEAPARMHPPFVLLQGGLQALLATEEGFAKKSWIYK